MNAPRSVIRRLELPQNAGDFIELDGYKCQRLLRYIKRLENAVEEAQAYAAKHADMYVRGQNERTKELGTNQ